MDMPVAHTVMDHVCHECILVLVHMVSWIIGACFTNTWKCHEVTANAWNVMIRQFL